MKKVISLGVIVVLMFSLLSLAGCGSSNSGNTSTSSTSKTEAKPVPGVTKDEVKIGAFVMASGAAAGVGQQMREGTNAYFSKINDAGGVNGRKIKWLTEDDALDPAKTTAVTKKLVEQDNIFAIVGPAGTATTLAVVPYITDNKVPLLFPQSASSQLLKPINPYVFGIMPSYEAQSIAMTDYIVKQKGAKKIGVLFMNDPVGAEGRDGVKIQATKLSIPIVEQEFPKDATDLSSQVTKMKESGVDSIVWYGGNVQQLASALKQAQQLNWKPQFIASTANAYTNTAELAGAAAEGLINACGMDSIADNTPGVQEFVATLKKYSPSAIPSSYSLASYVFAETFVEALKECGQDVTREKLLQALESGKTFEVGVMAPLKFSKDNHLASNQVFFTQIKNGKYDRITQGWYKPQ